MKTRIVILIVVFALLFAGSVALAQSSSPSVSDTVRQGALVGEGYHLTSLTWEVSGAAGGTGYRLVSPSKTTGTGTQCCCVHLPCVLR